MTNLRTQLPKDLPPRILPEGSTAREGGVQAWAWVSFPALSAHKGAYQCGNVKQPDRMCLSVCAAAAHPAAIHG